MDQYKSTINIFGDDITTSKTMGSKGVPEFAMPKKDDTSVLAKDLLPLHNKRDDRFQTDIQLNGKTRFEEKNTIIKSLEEEIVNMKHKLSFVYEKDEEIGKLKGTVNDLKKEIKELQSYSSECMKLRLENKNLKDQLDLQSMNKNTNDKLESENKNLKDKIKELTNEDNTITDITEFISDDDDLSYESDEELMDVNVPQLRSVLFRRLQDKQKQHIDNLINSYDLKRKNKVKKSVLEKMLEQAIHL